MNETVEYALGTLYEAVFIRRENRFRAEVELDGQIVKVHVPNSGRMQELLFPGAKVWVQPAAKSKKGTARKTAYTLMLTRQGTHYVCLHSHLANEIIAFWLEHHMLSEFAGYTKLEREKKIGTSRMDFRLERENRCCYVEVKSVNLLDGDIARFPDAPTDRGSRHLQELIHCKAQGMDAAVIFLVMGNNAEVFAPNVETDPAFAEQLTLAQKNGVDIYVYKCEIDLKGVRFAGRIPVQEESEWKSMH